MVLLMEIQSSTPCELATRMTDSGVTAVGEYPKKKEIEEGCQTMKNRKQRMGWDSNPRYAQTYASFQDWCLRPLGHPSRWVKSTKQPSD